MNYIDLVLAALLILGIVKGYKRGFIYEVAVLGAFFLGLYMAFHFAGWMQPWILKIADISGSTLHTVSFFVMFLAVMLGILFLARLFTKLVDIAALGIFNRIAGAVFGGLKFVFVISIILFFFNKADTNFHWLNPDTKAGSRLYYPVMKIAPAVFPNLEKVESVTIRLPDKP